MGKIFGGLESKGFICDKLKWGSLLEKLQQELGTWNLATTSQQSLEAINLLAPELFFLNFSTPCI